MPPVSLADGERTGMPHGTVESSMYATSMYATVMAHALAIAAQVDMSTSSQSVQKISSQVSLVHAQKTQVKSVLCMHKSFGRGGRVQKRSHLRRRRCTAARARAPGASPQSLALLVHSTLSSAAPLHPSCQPPHHMASRRRQRSLRRSFTYLQNLSGATCATRNAQRWTVMRTVVTPAAAARRRSQLLRL